MTVIALSSGPIHALLAPALGGAVLGLWRDTPSGRLPLLRSVESGRLAGAEPTDCAIFPMAPFANRLRANRLVAGRQTYQMTPNVSGQALCLHGDAWLSPWEPIRATQRNAWLAYNSEGSFWPYCYRAEQHLSVDEHGLMCRLTISNRGEPLPFGFGFHPYFPRHPTTRIQFEVRRGWNEGPDFLPSDPAGPGDLPNFGTLSTIPDMRLNNAYQGWSRTLAVVQEDARASVVMTASEPLDTLMVFTRKGADFIALEPQSHLPGALSDPEHSVPMLPSGESVECWISIGLLDRQAG